MREIDSLIEDVTPAIRELRRELHMHPEPAFEEFATAARIADRLATISGMEVRTNVAGTGVVATLGRDKSGPCVGLRADMDCLRMQEESDVAHASVKDGLMHACGHDGHTACLLGTAMVLAECADELVGPVKFIFQPAEENKGGARVMIEEGCLEDPDVDAIFGLHGTTALPLGSIGLNPGAMMAASRYFTINIHGRGCHAASPHRGIDPVVIGSQVICALQSIVTRNINPLEPALITIPKFTASTAPNVIPEKVVLEGTLRALSNHNREVLETRLKELVEQTAAAHGGTADIEFYGGYPPLENDPKEAVYVAQIGSSFLPMSSIIQNYPPSMGAEDFSFYLGKVPGAFFWLGLQPQGEPLPSLHHPRFDFNDEAIPTAIRMLSEIARKYAVR